MSGSALMVCGTASDVGKSRLVTGICRSLARRGLKVAPFKGQNMALNSVVTPDGAEIGRAQGAQAAACGVPAEAAMNPILLKPTSDRRSQVVVMGRPWRELDAGAFQGIKPTLVPVVLEALAGLRERFDVVVCEGAGSPAEINLMEGDLVNLGLAVTAGLPAVLVGDIDRGGVFAHLYGTVALLPEDRRRAIRGFVVNKFRGDATLLGNAMGELERRTGIPTLGIVPHLSGLWLDAEDSLGLAWPQAAPPTGAGEWLDVAVVAVPRISNFTDLDPLAAEPGVSVRTVAHPGQLAGADLVVLPGSKSTVADLAWLRHRGFAPGLASARAAGATILGICGGYQMLGDRLEDPDGVESAIGAVDGLGLLGVRTVFGPDKVTAWRAGHGPGGEAVTGYEIHHGLPEPGAEAVRWFDLDGTGPEGVRAHDHSVLGTSLHGLFESDPFRGRFLADVAARRGKARPPSDVSFAAVREAQIDALADACEAHLDMDAVLALAKEAQ